MSLIEQLQSLKVGMSRQSVCLAAHSPNWHEAFALVSAFLKRPISVGLELHHIGSTSIPQMSAKPIIDILGVVPSIHAFDSKQSDVEAVGFVWKGEYGIKNRRYCVLYDLAQEMSLVHLHIFEKDDHEVEKHLVFRDYLRANAVAASRYEELKKNLASENVHARTNYSEGKSKLIHALLGEAFEWRQATRKG